jgi:hypothetical protein
MFNKKMVMAVLVLTSLTALMAQAGRIGGWAFSYGSIDVHIDLSGVSGNYIKKASIAVVDAQLDQIEYLCLNPSNFNVAPGSAGQRTVSGSDVIDSGNILGKGQGTVDLSFEIPGDFVCVNPNWTFIPGTEVAKVILTTISWFACSGDVNDPSDTDGPCFDGNTLTVLERVIDQVEGVCTLNPVLRHADGTVIEGQDYVCVETSD